MNLQSEQKTFETKNVLNIKIPSILFLELLCLSFLRFQKQIMKIATNTAAKTPSIIPALKSIKKHWRKCIMTIADSLYTLIDNNTPN